MDASPLGNSSPILWDDGERVFCQSLRASEGIDHNVLIARPATGHPTRTSLDRIAHEFGLKDELDGAWALRPLDLLRDELGRTLLVLENPGGEPLSRLVGAPMETGDFLRLAVGIAAALGKLHQCGLVHKDIKPAHILVNCADGHARLTGFGLASRLRRERQAPEPPETIAGTLAYMAPEQTGRMNRSIDSRSDLYAFGVTLYQMLTGELPFAASDAMEWVHCHIARKPVPPSARVETVPALVSDIVMKLLAKTAEERYQTAAGVEHDLQRCLADWQRWRRVVDFPLDEHGTPDRLLIPEKLYGREHEVDTLVASFTRIVGSGEPELVLVSGYSGIGKSSVVNELHKVLVPPRGNFAYGKFDQYKRNVPYSTLVQAFQGLVRTLLGKRDVELASWRSALLEALDPNARLMTDLIPELKLIISDPPPVPELEPQQAQRRFMLVFRRFIGVFARAEHPLALFLDDLQWLDAATLDLFEDLLTGSDLQHLMLIGAYRDNEVDASHPLTAKLQAIRSAGVKIDEIKLAPLAGAHIKQLIAEALHCEPERIEPLARLVHDKTAGNPFFVIQFLHALVDEDLLTFDHDAGRWCWDPDRIHSKGYTDNVVDLMVGKLTRLPAETQQALQQLACLGNVAGITALSTVLGIPEAQVHTALWEAIRHELVEKPEGAYAFVHDRVHEAAYSLIPEGSRAEAHLRIGRLLAAQTPPEKREEAIFEIVGQLNRGAALITDQKEREQLAEFNLVAGLRAKASTAYASALTYLVKGAELMSDDCWERRHGQIFALELNRAECEFLTGQVSAADARLAVLSQRATTTVEKALVACLHMEVHLLLDRADHAVAVCLAYLRHVGIEWSPHPNDDEVRREYKDLWSRLGDRTIEELVDLPLMEDAASLATVQALSKLYAPAVHTDGNLACLTVCKAVSLSIERGNCDASCLLYANIGRVAGQRFGDYQAGYRFGQLGCDLIDRRGLKRFEASTFLCFSIFVERWMKPVRNCRALLARAFAAANRIGDIPYGAYCCNSLNSDLLFAGEPLPELQAEAERGLAYAEKMRFGQVIDFITTQLALIRMLRGLSPSFGCFDDEQFNELRTEVHLSSNPALALAAGKYWARKLQARYLAGDYAVAMDAASKGEHLLWVTSGFCEEAEHHFFAALTHAALYDSAPAGEWPQHLDAMAAHHMQLQTWTKNCPENFGSRTALVGAEIARIEGRVGDAEQLYEQAIRASQESGFVHTEALANELASRFYAARGLEKVARVYLQDARYGYLRWGANGKVWQLEQTYPYLRTEEPAPSPTSTIATPVEHLDLATVIKVSQAAGDIVLDKLIDMIMRTAIEQAGAERGLLILSDGSEQRIVAEAKTGGDATQVQLRDEPVSAAMLPESVLYHVLRTQENVFLDDAAAGLPFAGDPYIPEHRARSILCLPLMYQAKLTGALYLENNLTARVFSPARIAVLKLVASQAAVSLENARLYRDIAEREAKIRRLIDVKVIEIKQAEEKVRESEWRYREVQTELAHANRVATMGQLAASIAHEINQPIAATMINAQGALRYLSAQPPDVTKVGQALARIVRDANRAGNVLGRIRDLIRKAPPQKEPVDINEAIREVVELTRGEVTKSSASIEAQLADSLPFVEGNRVELQQVLVNLIINSLEAMIGVDDGVRDVLISTGKDKSGDVLVAVRDSGRGFGPHNAESVFAPFFTTKPMGLGMGLSICRSIIDAHGGRLWASANLPRGAAVQFTLLAHPTHSPVA